jgi:hypothetical protein
MTLNSRLQADLNYVRDALDRSGRPTSPASIYWLWAIIVLVGFPLVDFAPRLVAPYWIVMGPLGGVASGFLGYRFSRQLGQVDRRTGGRHALHWAGCCW